MTIHRWTLWLAATLAFGQETVPFSEEPARPWTPAWELVLRSDQLENPKEASEGFHRVDAQLRLRWTWDLDAFRLVAGTRSAVGSDGNAFNAPRWDQQPSNGTQVDVAHGEVSWLRERAFGTLRLGLQENGLLASQALWDRDLRFLGLGGGLGIRGAAGDLQEAGLRVAVGQVPNVLGGQMRVAAGQAVLKLDTGPWSWTAHAGRWALSWDAGVERRRALPHHDPAQRQQLSMDALGAASRWNTILPLELRWFHGRNRESGETSEEVQGTIGSRERPYWPQVSITWQRLSSTGTLYPVNGDEWWFYRATKGHRADLALPLRGGWIASLVYLRQRRDGEDYPINRRMLVLQKRF
jgi:hypothetical protein